MDFNEIKEQILHPQDVSDMFAPEDIEANKIVAAFSTVPMLFWLPLAACKDSRFGMFYANQGLTLLILSAVCGVGGSILAAIFSFIPFIGGLIGALIGLVCGLLPTACWLLLFVNAMSGKAVRIPLIGELVNPFKF